jgi:hypothetical protein
MADNTVKCPQCGTITHKSAAHTCRQVYVSEARLKQLEAIAEAAEQAKELLEMQNIENWAIAAKHILQQALDAPGGGEGNEGR